MKKTFTFCLLLAALCALSCPVQVMVIDDLFWMASIMIVDAQGDIKCQTGRTGNLHPAHLPKKVPCRVETMDTVIAHISYRICYHYHGESEYRSAEISEVQWLRRCARLRGASKCRYIVPQDA